MSSFIDVRIDFHDRTLEIDTYFDFVISLVDGKMLLKSDTSAGGKDFSTEQVDTLTKTLKANCFLLLYNLVESTTKNSIQAIFDDLKTGGVSYDDCRDEIKKVVIKNLKREALGINSICVKLTIIAQHIVTETFDKDELAQGNIDAKKIRGLADAYGFARPRADGSKLLEVKTNRNDLAHGNKTFAEVGREYTSRDLSEMRDQVKRYLNAFIDNVEDYSTRKLYLASAPASATSATP